MTNPPNIDAIIAELSEAQRRLMLGNTRFVRWATYEKLIKLGLLYQVGGFVNRTELGSRVRSALIGEVGRDG